MDTCIVHSCSISCALVGSWHTFLEDQMNTVWVLVAVVFNGHFTNSIIPTLEFKTQEKCLAAIEAFKAETADKQGKAFMRCVRIEK